MDDKPDSSAQLNQAATWRERVTSSIGLPASKRCPTMNRFGTSGCRENSLSVDKVTEPRPTFDEPATGSLLSPTSHTALPETETTDNDAVENGTSNENYVQSADEEDRQSSESCNDDVEEMDSNCISFQISGNSHLWLGSRVVSVLDSGAERPGFKSQSRRCRVTVVGKLFTPIVPLFTKQQKW